MSRAFEQRSRRRRLDASSVGGILVAGRVAAEHESWLRSSDLAISARRSRCEAVERRLHSRT